MEELQKLFDVLTRDGYYTKSFEEFQTQLGTTEYQDKVFDVVTRDGLFTQDKATFLNKYTVKKKDSSDLPGDGVEEVTDVNTTEVETPSGDVESINILNETLVNGKPFFELSTEDQQSYVDNMRENTFASIPKNTAPAIGNSPIFSQSGPDIAAMQADAARRIQEAEDMSREDIIAEREGEAIREFDIKKANVLEDFITGSRESKTQIINGRRVEVRDEIEEGVEMNPTSVPDSVFSNVDIDKVDYLMWENKNRRKEEDLYKNVQDFFFGSETGRVIEETKMSSNLASYTQSLGKAIQGDIDKIENQLKFASDPAAIKQLTDAKAALTLDLISNIKTGVKIFDNFKYLKQEVKDDVGERKELFLAGQTGGATFVLKEGEEIISNGADAVVGFLGGIVGFVPSMIDAGSTLSGFDDKGLMSSLVDAISNGMNTNKLATQRAVVAEGKSVTSRIFGKETDVLVTNDGDIVDKTTNVSLRGILSDDHYKKILNQAKDVKFSTTNFTAGSALSGGTGTIVNLAGLILGGKIATKALSKGAKKLGKTYVSKTGSLGMGLTSYASGVMGEVEGIKRELMAAGYTEDEATNYAVIAGNAKASLDGVFSAIAGGNTKLLSNTKGVASRIVDLAKNPRSWAKQGAFQGKVKDLVNENLKELFIEELPVLFAGKAINSVVNTVLGAEVLNTKTGYGEIQETVMMTIGATSGLGTVGLLSGNKRKDLLRFVANSEGDLQKKIDKLVNDGMLTKEEGQKAYDEIYNFGAALNKTQDSIIMSENVVPVANLLDQREKLKEKENNLEGPLKVKVTEQIAAIDEQIADIQAKDNAQAILDAKGKVVVTKEEALENLKNENAQRQKAGLPVLLESNIEIEKARQRLIKTKTDAISESSTEGVDVKEFAADSETVDVGDTSGAITEKSSSQGQDKSKAKEKKVNVQSTLGQKGEINARERIAQPIRVPKTSMDVNLNPDGSVKSIVKKGTKKNATKAGIKKAGKFILTDVIDVNAGKEAVIPEGVTNPNEVSNIISNQSNNVKQVALEIENERKRFLEEKNNRNQMADVEGGINEIIGMKFTAESWERLTGNKPSEDGISSRWISKDGRTIEDGWVDDAPDLTLEKVTEFIKTYPTTKAINDYQKGDVGITSNIEKLKDRFKKLTGLEATDTNVETAISIDPNREPIEVTKEKARTQASKDSTDPNVPDFGKKKGPSAKKILGIKDKKNIEVDEIKGLKDVLKRELKRAKDLLLDQSKRREALSGTIKMLADIGSIKVKKAAALIKAISGVNVNNASAVLRVTNYVEKVFQNAANVEKLSSANNIKKRIGKLLKSKNIEANVEASVRQFLEINPELVNDLDLYLENLSDVFYKLKPTKAQLVGIQSDLDGIQLINEPNAKIKKFNKRASVNPQAVNVNNLDSYSKTVIDEQKIKLFDAEKQIFEDVTGLDSKELSLGEMREILSSLKLEEDLDLNKLKVKEGAIKEAVLKAFDKFGALVQGEITNDKDPLTGEKSQMSKDDKVLLQSFLDMDLDSLNPEQQMRALDALVNYATNKTTGGMKQMIKNYEGITKADALSKVKGFVAKKLKFAIGGKLGAEFWASQLSTINSVFESVFVGQGKALKAEQESGFTELKNGAAFATKLANDIIDSYSKKFITNKGRFSDGLRNVFKSKGKPQPNGEVFESLYNDVERGLFAFMRRTKIGTETEQKNEFTRRKKLIVDSIEVLEKGDSSQKRLAEAYQKAFDKIAKGSESINDLESKVDPINVEAVDFITQEWAKNRDALDDVSLNIYNKILGTDLNYTTDVYTKVGETDSEVELGESVFQGQQKTIYDKKTGVLMETKRPEKLPNNSIIDLGFDIAQTRSLEKALTDIYTAPAIQQIKGFVNSKGFKKLIPNENDRKLLKDRIKNFVNLKRKFNPEFDQVAGVNVQKVKNIVDYVASLGVSRALGSIVQFPKQLVPLVATAWNAGGKFTAMGVNLLRKSEVQDFLNNSGYAIANRGVANITTLDGTNKKLERAAQGTMSKIGKAIGSLNQTWLQSLLVKPDKIAARGSWIAYYMKDIKRQGLDPANIEWDVKKLNKQAADYAQQQVDRQQNTSDADLQGRFFTSKALGQSVARKALFAFSNFLINQKTRMYNDIGVLSSKLANREDKKSAIKSLAGLMTETLTFNTMGYALGQAVSELVFGDEEDEETKEKTKKNRIKGRTGNVVKDLLSPIPLTDPLVIKGVNKLISITSGTDKPFQFFSNDRRTFNESMGVLGIPLENADVLFEMVEMGITGTYNVEFMGSLTKKELTSRDQDKLYLLFTSYLMYSVGMVPADIGPIIKKKLKLLKKGSAAEIKRLKKLNKSSKTKKKTYTKSGLPKSPLTRKNRSPLPKSPIRR